MRGPLAYPGPTKPTSNDEQAAPALWHPVLRHVHDLMALLISERAEVINELIKYGIPSQSGNILCQDGHGPQDPDEPCDIS